MSPLPWGARSPVPGPLKDCPRGPPAASQRGKTDSGGVFVSSLLADEEIYWPVKYTPEK